MRFTISLLVAGFGTAVLAEPPKVAVDIAPVHGLVAQVMEGVGSPELVIPLGADPHGYAMRPSEARALAQADIVFWVGPSLTPWLADPIETLAAQAQHITLSEVDGITLLPMRQDARFEAHDHGDHAHGDDEDAHAHDDHGEHAHGDHAHDHAHDDHADEHAHDAHADEHAHDDHAHAKGAIDGHMWLNPDNAVLWLDEISTTLAAQDPENADIYRSNAEKASADIEALSETISSKLISVQAQPFIVFHDSYYYFEEHFGVTAVAAVTMSDGGAASAARLADVREIVAETGASCALAEPRASQGLIDAVAEGAQITVKRIDSVGVDIPTGPAFYPTLLLQISDVMASCLSGQS